MRKIYFFIIAFLAFTKTAVAINYLWVGGPTGDYQVGSNWSPAAVPSGATDILQFNATSAIQVTNVPTTAIGAIQILTGTSTVSFAANANNILTLSAAIPLIYTTAGSILSADQLTIQLNNPSSFTISQGVFGISPSTGGKIIINGQVVLAGGTLDFDVAGTGGATISATGSITYTSGIFTSLLTSSITWLTGANYNHNVSGASASVIPAATWQPNSNCNITGMNAGSAAITGFNGISFANFNWNCALQSAFVDLNLPAVTVFFSGAFSVINTNSQYLSIGSATGSSVNVASYSQTGGNVWLQSSSGNTAVVVTGAFSHTGGMLDWVGNGGAGSATLNLMGTVAKSAASTWACSSTNNAAQMILQFSASATQTVGILGAWSSPTAGRCNIVNSNTDVINGISLTGTLKVINTASGSPASFTMNGKITGGTVTYTGTASFTTTLIYGGGSSQTASAIEFPTVSAPNNLTINNSAGVSFPASSFSRTIPGTLIMTIGNLAIGGNTLFLTNTTLATQLTYTAGFITTGTLSRTFPASGLPLATGSSSSLFPFGTGSNDRSLNVYFSASSITTGGTIAVSHTPVVGVISPLSIVDNGVTLDKSTATYWSIATSGLILGVTTASITAVGANIGAIDQIAPLRLTDDLPAGPLRLGGWIFTTGSTSIPTVGKSGLGQTSLNTTLYIGSDGLAVYNPLIIITFNWTGALSTAWTNGGNWSTPYSTGYPSASTEIAIINTSTVNQPTINSGESINVYQLTVSANTLFLVGNASLIVYDQIVNFSGGKNFDVLSTFGYASSNNPQTIWDLPYGNLTVSGSAVKTLAPPSITVKNTYKITGSMPLKGTGIFIYAGAGAQRIEPANYYNLTISPRAGIITTGYGNGSDIIDIENVFDVSGLTAANSQGPSPVSYTTVNFSGAFPQNIPGFFYPYAITNANYPRTLDPLGSTSVDHVIWCRTISHGAAYTVTNSKIDLFVSGLVDATYTGDTYYDLEISGNLNGHKVDFFSAARTFIAGKFTVSLTNYQQGSTNNVFCFNGTNDQTITAFKTNSATNTPAWKYSDLAIAGGSRNVLLGSGSGAGGTDTIFIRGALKPQFIPPGTASPFGASNGFIVGKSTVDFNTLGSTIPVLKHFSAPLDSTYNNVNVSSATRALTGNMIIGGNLSVTGSDVNPSTLTIGGGSGVTRLVTVLGNMSATGAGTGAQVTGQIDLNPGTLGATTVKLAGNLSISGNGQLMGTTSSGTNNGVVLFNGSTAQAYSNTSITYNNGLVNFVVGDGTLASNLTLNSKLNMLASSNTQNKSTLTVTNNSSLDCGTNNIFSNAPGNAIFNLNAGATLLTANTGGIEGTASSPSAGSIINDATIVKAYDALASYQFNASTVTPFPAAITPMANLTIGDNTTVQLNKSIEVSNTFTLKTLSSAFDLSGSDLTLKSTATATARVAPVPAGATVSYSGIGRFNVERNYRGKRRAWYLVTSPLTNTNSIYDTWQISGGNTPGRGTFVTGTIAGTGVAGNGLDNGPFLNSSLKAGDALTVVNDTKATLLSSAAASAANKGYFLFVRGDRTTVANYNTSIWNATTLSSRGNIQIGAQTFPASSTSGAFTMIGNPYASPVSVSAATKTNLNSTFYVWDPYNNSTLGTYVTIHIDGSGNVDNITPASNGGLATLAQPLILQSSQAFWVQTFNNGIAQIQFDEPNKSAVFNVGTFRQMRDLTKSFRTNLNLVEANDSIILADGNFVQFDNQYSKGVDLNDALKFGNIKETFGFLRDGKSLTVERRPEITANDTLFFKLTKTTQRNYQFQFVPTNMAGVLTSFLEDSYTNAKTIVSLTATSTFNFTINADAASAAADRFRIVFTASVAGPLPVTYKSIKAYQQGKDIAVDWTVENEIDISKYEVEKSTDGTNFTKVNTTTAKGTSGSIDYTFVDTKAVRGNNFYRIKNYNQGGSFDYSRVVLVKMGKEGSGISIYPNPVSGNSIGMAMTNMAQGIYQVRLINTIGQTVMTKRINHATGNSMETLTPDSQLSTGIYQLEVTAPDKRISSTKVIVQ